MKDKKEDLIENFMENTDAECDGAEAIAPADEINHDFENALDEQEALAVMLKKKKRKKRQLVSGIILGIINIILSIPALCMFVVDAMLLFEGIKMSFQTLEGWEGLGLAIILVYGIAFWVIAVLLSIPSLIYFIVSMCMRNKFFKISASVVFAITLIASILSVLAYAFIWADAKFGWF